MPIIIINRAFKTSLISSISNLANKEKALDQIAFVTGGTDYVEFYSLAIVSLSDLVSVCIDLEIEYIGGFNPEIIDGAHTDIRHSIWGTFSNVLLVFIYQLNNKLKQKCDSTDTDDVVNSLFIKAMHYQLFFSPDNQNDRVLESVLSGVSGHCAFAFGNLQDRLLTRHLVIQILCIFETFIDCIAKNITTERSSADMNLKLVIRAIGESSNVNKDDFDKACDEFMPIFKILNKLRNCFIHSDSLFTKESEDISYISSVFNETQIFKFINNEHSTASLSECSEWIYGLLEFCNYLSMTLYEVGYDNIDSDISTASQQNELKLQSKLKIAVEKLKKSDAESKK